METADGFSEEALEAGRVLFAGSVVFVKGVVDLKGLPTADRPEVCFAAGFTGISGRSFQHFDSAANRMVVNAASSVFESTFAIHDTESGRRPSAVAS